MNVIPETHSVHFICYLRFNYNNIPSRITTLIDSCFY